MNVVSPRATLPVYSGRCISLLTCSNGDSQKERLSSCAESFSWDLILFTGSSVIMVESNRGTNNHSRPVRRERYMSDKTFSVLRKALEEALAFERGDRRNLLVTRIQTPQEAMSFNDI